MTITSSEKRAKISDKKTEIQQLQYDLDLLIDQHRSADDIKALKSRIAAAKRELKVLDALPVREQEPSVTIKVSGHGIINQVNAGNNFGSASQYNDFDKQIDLSRLEKELGRLHKEMKKLSKTREHDIAVGAIAQAADAAKSNDRSKVLEHLKTAGKWALDVATKIGTSLATDALKLALGL